MTEIKDYMDEILDQVYNEYYYFLDIGLIFPQIHSKRWIAFFNFRLALLFGTLFYVGGCFLYTTILSDSLSIFAFAFHVFMLGVITVSTILTSHANQTDGLKFVLFFFIQKHLYCPYGKSGKAVELQEKKQRIQRTLALFWPIYYGVVSMVLILVTPVLDNYLGMASLPNESGNGIAYTLPITSWTPFDADHSVIAYYVTFAFQAGYFICIVIPITTGLLFILGNILSLQNEFSILIHSLEKLNERAATLHRQEYPERKVNKMSKEYDDCYYKCLRENIIHHQFILKSYNMYQSIASLPLLIPFAGSSMLIALTGAHVISDDPRIAMKVNEVLLTLGEILLMATLCVLGETFTEESERLRETFYNIQWYYRSIKVKRAVSICLHVTTNPIVFKVGNLMTINHNNFGAIMQSAYSMFNLFYATQHSD